MKKRVFSGIQPSGLIHIGNYLGAISQWVQDQTKYESIFCIVDLHAITVPQNPKELAKNIRELAKIYLASGISPQKSTIFIQSHRPEHAELGWILSCVSKIGEMKRMTQFKEKAEKHQEQSTLGLFAYPTLMAADILLYDADLVPVGEDQKQHVELSRTLARRFNAKYGQTFKVPAVQIRKEGQRIMGLDNPKIKMSKSASSPYNWIALRDKPNVIRNKIKKAVTDSGTEVVYSDSKPALKNLINIYSLFSGIPVAEIEKRYKNQGYAKFKVDLAEVVISALLPIQKKLEEYDKNPQYIEKVLKEGTETLRPLASQKLEQVKAKMGLG